MDATAQSDLRGVLPVLGIAFAVRLAYFLELVRFPLFSTPTADTLKYLGRAQEIVAGHWLGEGIYFHSSPVYSYGLAAALQTGIATPVDLSTVAWLQLLVSTATAGLTWAVGSRLAGPRAGLIAGLVYALSPGAVFYDGELLGDFLLPLVMVSTVLVLLHRPVTLGRLLGAGALIGLGALARPNFLVLLAPVALVTWTHPAQWIRRVAALSLGAALLVGPVTVRNMVVGGDTVLISSNGGVNLYIGNNPDATGTFSAPPYWDSNLEAYSTQAAEQVEGRSLRPSEVSAHYSRQAWGWMVHHPIDYLRLVGRRLRLTMGHYEIPNHMDLNFFQSQSTVLRWLPMSWGWIVPLAGAGLIVSSRRRRPHWLPILLVGFYTASIVGLFFVTGRYRFPIFPLLAVFVGTGVADWHGTSRARRLAAALVGGVLGLGAMLAPPDGVRIGEAYSYQHLAAAHRLQGEVLEEIAALQAGLESEDEPASRAYLYNNLGIAQARSGNIVAALQASKEAMELAPDNRETLQNRVLILGQSGQPDQAEALLVEQLSRTPGDAYLLVLMGQVYRWQGRESEAVGVLEASLQSEPRADTWFQLALCHETLGNVERARQAWGEGLRLDPHHEAAQQRLQALGAPQ